MMRASSLALATFLFVGSSLICAEAYGEFQYWVSVGSYQQQASADRARNEAVSLSSEGFSVIGTDTAKGYYYRVAAGPFLTRELAEDRVRTALDQGYAGAWLWTDESDVFNAGLSASTDLGYTSSLDTSFDASLDYSLDLDTDSYGYMDDLGDEEGLIENREKPPELVREAPPGYQLNKMLRER